MSDKFKELKETVGNIINLNKNRNDYKKVYDKVSNREIQDIFNIIDKHSNNPKSIERECKKYINGLFE